MAAVCFLFIWFSITVIGGIPFNISETPLSYDSHVFATKSNTEDRFNALDFSDLSHLEGNHSEEVDIESTEGSANLFQGDIKIEDPEKFFTDAFDRTVLSKKHRLWPKGVIPVLISKKFSLQERATIQEAIQTFHKRTCLKFVHKTNHMYYLHVVKKNGCWSYFGRTGKQRQELSLGPNCVHKGTVLHEFMHALAFVHEHNRPDRDAYVRVMWDAIQKKKKDNFKKFSWFAVDNLGVPYDYASIMHYGRYTFAKDPGRPTIKPSNPTREMGQRKYLSQKDVQKINLLYNCKGSNPPVKVTTHVPVFRPIIKNTCYDINPYCPWIYSAYGYQCQYYTWIRDQCQRTCGMC